MKICKFGISVNVIQDFEIISPLTNQITKHLLPKILGINAKILNGI